jgi:hypothetical protein
MTTWSFVLAVLIAIFALYLSSTAGRLDRLHLRIEADLVALDRQLQHRCGAASELIAAAVFDPATTILLGQAVHQARTADREDRVGWAMSESKLTSTLGVALADPVDVEEMAQDIEAAELLAELAGACRQVELSRRFLNDGVDACRKVRRHRMIRWFRLAGHAPWPRGMDLDDLPPPGLTGR